MGTANKKNLSNTGRIQGKANKEILLLLLYWVYGIIKFSLLVRIAIAYYRCNILCIVGKFVKQLVSCAFFEISQTPFEIN